MENTEKHFLYPSALFVSNKNFDIHTILGSCIAVCIFDTKIQQGGICHYMLPLWNGEGLASPKYGNIAIEKLIKKMLDLGSDKKNLIAKIFGGGEVIETKITSFHIGERNTQLALEKLKEHHIPIKASSVGGKLGRKIIFNTQTGAVKHRFIQKQIMDKKN